MQNWGLIHPWMTFFIIILIILAIDAISENVTKIIINRQELKEKELNLKIKN